MSEFLPRSMAEMMTDFPPELEHLSASSINMALRCEEQWRQRYIKGLIKPPSLSMLAGRADHAAIEVSMDQKILSFEDLPVTEVEEQFLYALETGVDEQGGLTELADPETAVASYDGLRREGPKVVGLYHKLISPSVQPTAVEKKFDLVLPDLPVKLHGYIDLVTATRVIDRKRSTRSMKSPKVDWVMQAGIYQLVEPKPYSWHVSVTTKTPQFQTDLEQEIPHEGITERRLRDVALKLGFLYQRYGPDEPWPATGRNHDWACSYCGYRPDCWAWK